MDAHKKPNLETTHNHHLGRRRRNVTVPSTSSPDFKKTHEECFVKNLEGACEDHKVIRKRSLLAAEEGGHKAERSTTPPPPQRPEASMAVEEESGRERLKRLRVEMSGRVWIPDIWGQEDLLKKWIDCTVFDSSLEKNSVMSAREALIQEGRSTLRIENSC
ncbi:hypothetical protein L2E82_12455 [Cichorium intybus]|uniref:Uncharacterized protein n=1 Tax=Cichorium intybus TaxID=13427 RepID=A0ACB9GH67_CICIN|nr:hypothetical protein L2E82_12455 [Cichorium intybus]